MKSKTGWAFVVFYKGALLFAYLQNCIFAYFTRESLYLHSSSFSLLCKPNHSFSPLFVLHLCLPSMRFQQVFLKIRMLAKRKENLQCHPYLKPRNIFSHFVSPAIVKTQRLAYTGTRGLFLNTLGLLLMSAMATSCAINKFQMILFLVIRYLTWRVENEFNRRIECKNEHWRIWNIFLKVCVFLINDCVFLN